MRRTLAGLAVAAALLSGCSASPSDPPTVGDQQLLCGRVPRALAEKAVGRAVDQLVLLNGFAPKSKDGECALSDDSGALLDVSVVKSSDNELEMKLRELAPIANYSGDQVSAVAGEGPRTDAYVAVDDHHYVWVQLNTGSSDEQRAACLAIGFEVAATTRTLG